MGDLMQADNNTSSRTFTRRILRRFFLEQVIPLALAIVAGFVSLEQASGVSASEALLWALVTYLLALSVTSHLLSLLEREELKRQMEEIPANLQRTIDRVLRTNVRAMEVYDNYLKIWEDRPAFKALADMVLQRANDDLLEILSRRNEYTMRVDTPIKDYVSRWYDIMASLAEGVASFDTVSNMVIWSEGYFGGTGYADLQRRSKMKIRRIIVVPSEGQLKRDPEWAKEILRGLEDYRNRVHESGQEEKDVQTKIWIARDTQEYRQHFVGRTGHSGEPGHSNNFAIWKISPETKLQLTVQYAPDGAQDEAKSFKVTGITFGQNPQLIDEKEGLFRSLIEDSKRLCDISKYITILENTINGKDPQSGSTPGAREAGAGINSPS